VALAGFCPVSLVQGCRLIPGQPALSLSYEGLVYRFADDRMRTAFRNQPGRFLPANGGHCPVAQVDRSEVRPGEALWSVLYRDRLFLCADREAQARFMKNPERYARALLADL
jgi:YHS domain-containing protein